jgi:gamma-glutamyltranspeptidase / glutathione hydrolase
LTYFDKRSVHQLSLPKAGMILKASLICINLGFTLSFSQVLQTSKDEMTAPVHEEHAPEAQSPLTFKPGWTYQHEAVASANPIASKAGLKILQQGGNAVDAAICVQMVLSLVEPQSSGIGGGAFLVLTQKGKVFVYDGRETAPRSASVDMFQDSLGRPLPFKSAQLSPRSVGVPGVVAMLWQAHQIHGQLPWHKVIEPAIKLAKEGFPVSPRLHLLLSQDSDLLADPSSRSYFYDANGSPWPVGYVLKNPQLAEILTDIAKAGPKAFYSGKWALQILNTVNAGSEEKWMSELDLKNYRPVVRTPLCFDFSINQTAPPPYYRICGAPPPASGTLAIAQIFGLLSKTDASKLPFNAEWIHYYTEASRLSFADRSKYVADLDFADRHLREKSPKIESPIQTQWSALFDDTYLNSRAPLIGSSRMKAPSYGVPIQWAKKISLNHINPMPVQEEHGTTHISIIDRYQNAVALTSSIESAFGVHRMVRDTTGLSGGFLLNSQLTDFSFIGRGSNNQIVLNQAQANKRPRSSMSPTLVFKCPSLKKSKSCNIFASLGSPGGVAIIHYTAQTLWAMLKWDMSPQEAVDLPHFTISNEDADLILEKDSFHESWVNLLRDRGQIVRFAPLTSGVQALLIDSSGQILGAADPRREGFVAGD